LVHDVAHPKERLAMHMAKIEEARRAGVQLLVFPETSLPGYPNGQQVRQVAISADDEVLTRLAGQAGAMTVVLGFAELGSGSLYYNSIAWLRAGQVLGVHRKVNLATYGNLDEGKHFAHGTRVETLEMANGWQAAGLICADAWNPALVYLAALRHASLLAVPVASAVEAVGDEFDNPANWDINSKYIAMTYGLPVVRCNWAGRFGQMAFWGGSAIFDAYGKELARAGAGEELIHADLDLEQIHTARFLLPTLRDAQPMLIRSELDRLLAEEPR
jgi:predicted amidohydrolase